MNLGQTELFDTMEILDELVKEGYLSPSDWEPTQTAGQSGYRVQMCAFLIGDIHHLTENVTFRRQNQQQNGWTSQNSTRPEEEKKDLRIWMRRKQRDRLAAYQKHRQSLREREHKPFSASSAGVRYACLFTPRCDIPVCFFSIYLFCKKYLLLHLNILQLSASRKQSSSGRNKDEKEK